MNWSDYKRESGEGALTGDYRCVITEVAEKISSSGNKMLEITVKPSGRNFTVKNWIVQNEYMNQNLTRFFDAFPSIPEGNFDFVTWVGAMGAARFAPDDRGYTKIQRWIPADRAVSLPEWVGDKPIQQEVNSLDDLEDEDDIDIPFD